MEGYTYGRVLACCCVLVSIFCSHGQTGAYNITDTCPENINLDNITLQEIDNMSHPINDDIKYNLYKVNDRNLTWCDSYKVCKQRGQRLAVLDTKDLQQKVTTLNTSDVSEIWIAGRRKDYGSDWTWINDTLTDLSDNFTLYDSNDKTKDCVRITLTRTGELETTADNCAFLKNVLCVVSGQVTLISQTLSWNKAMNLCVNKGGRLATWQDITNIGRDGNSYWFGLHRKPWIWIDSDHEVHPVFYSSWLSTSGGDCMMLRANGSWMATQCNTSLQYIICEEHTPPTTEPSTLMTTGMQDGGSSNNTYSRSSNIMDSQGTLIIALSVTGGVIFIIVLVLLTLYLLKRGRKNSIVDKNAYHGREHNNRNRHRINQQREEIQPYEIAGMSPGQHSQQRTSDYQQLAEPTLTVFKNTEIVLQSVIMSGNYCDIWKGQLKSKENLSLGVVIKAVKDTSDIYQMYLREQATTMSKLRSSDSTVACFGISQDNKYLIMENASIGNLETFLKEKSSHSYYNVTRDQDLPTLMRFIFQIIAGVKSVNELQPPALFYCLSASNVLMTNQQECKLTGFATSTAVTEREKWEDEHNLPRPIRWLAPEAIKLNHRRESDIWSLGVLLWQITSHGERPLAEKTDEETKQLILNGYRLLKPLNCSEELFSIISNCLIYQPTKRPSIHDVQSECEQITQYEVV